MHLALLASELEVATELLDTKMEHSMGNLLVAELVVVAVSVAEPWDARLGLSRAELLDAGLVRVVLLDAGRALTTLSVAEMRDVRLGPS